jgi:hypothetical protein
MHIYKEVVCLQDLKQGDFCPTITIHHQEIHGRRITRWWLGSSTNTVHAGPSLFRWDPCARPTWIQVIFVWDPHQVGPTYISCGTHNSIE